MSNSINLGKAGVSIIETGVKPVLGNVGEGLPILKGYNGNILEARSIVGLEGITAILDEAESQIELSLDAEAVQEIVGIPRVYQDLYSLDEDIKLASSEIDAVALSLDHAVAKLREEIVESSEGWSDVFSARLIGHAQELDNLRGQSSDHERYIDNLDTAIQNLQDANTTLQHKADSAVAYASDAAARLRVSFLVANASLIISLALVAERLWRLVP